MIKSISLISLNVFSFRLFYEKEDTNVIDNDKVELFYTIIKEYNPELLLLQEDSIHKRSFYPPGYFKVSGYLRSNEGLMNSILVREDSLQYITFSDNTFLESSRTKILKDQMVDRTASIIFYKGLKICNLHLTGGRIDDTLFKEITYLRDRQVSVYKDFDIVAGDFNGNPVKLPITHPIYKNANKKDKQTFKEYFQSGHKVLIENGLVSFSLKQSTDIFGGNPDHIYYNPMILQLLDVQVIKTIPLKLSDHNGIYVCLKGGPPPF